MELIDDKIDTFLEATVTSVNEIIEGSNEHLDLILSVVKPLDRLSEKFESLNQLIYQSIGSLSDDTLKNHLLPKLKDVNRQCMTLIGAVRTCYLYENIRLSFKRFRIQYDILREMIHDLQNIKLAADDDFDSLMKELNEM